MNSFAAEQRFTVSVLLEPLLEPLQDAFGDYGGIAQQEFATALSRMTDRPDG